MDTKELRIRLIDVLSERENRDNYGYRKNVYLNPEDYRELMKNEPVDFNYIQGFSVKLEEQIERGVFEVDDDFK